ncbi:Tf2-9, partial [Mucuna pruriens]
MCDASNLALGVVLGQRVGVGKPVHLNYTTTEKELVVIVFGLDKFRSYLLDLKIIVFSNHAALRFLLKKPDAKPRLIRWMLLLQEFNIEIRDKKGAENSIANHLSRIEKEDDSMPIRYEFPYEQLLHITTPTWFADICNFVAASQFPPKASRLYRERLQNDTKHYIRDDPYLWRLYNDQFIRRCILDVEINSVLQFCHAVPRGRHYGSTWTTRKVLDCRFYWPTISRDAYQFVSSCEKCQKAGVAISRRHEMPQQPILFYEVFDVWGIDFMGPFPVSNGYSYILLVVDYVSRWVEAIAIKTNDAKVVVDFLKFNIFCRFGVPKALISDQSSHFCNRAMSLYSTIGRTGADSLKMLFRHIELHTELRWGCPPIGLSLAVKQCILAYDQVGEQRKFQLQELDELRLEAYENSRIYKQKVLRKEFQVSQKLIIGKLCSRWDEPFVITNVFPYGAVELKDEHTNNTFQVNGHRIKPFHEGPTPIAGNMETISLMEPASPKDTL